MSPAGNEPSTGVLIADDHRMFADNMEIGFVLKEADQAVGEHSVIVGDQHAGRRFISCRTHMASGSQSVRVREALRMTGGRMLIGTQIFAGGYAEVRSRTRNVGCRESAQSSG